METRVKTLKSFEIERHFRNDIIDYNYFGTVILEENASFSKFIKVQR